MSSVIGLPDGSAADAHRETSAAIRLPKGYDAPRHGRAGIWLQGAWIFLRKALLAVRSHVAVTRAYFTKIWSQQDAAVVGCAACVLYSL